MAGSVVHVELPSADANRAASFWNGLFGWGLGDSAMEGFDYRMAQIAPEQGVAVFPSPDAPGSGALVYFSTDDIDASVAKVRELAERQRTSSPFRRTAGSPPAPTPRATGSASGRTTRTRSK